jgi:hypothetical protein
VCWFGSCLIFWYYLISNNTNVSDNTNQPNTPETILVIIPIYQTTPETILEIIPIYHNTNQTNTPETILVIIPIYQTTPETILEIIPIYQTTQTKPTHLKQY